MADLSPAATATTSAAPVKRVKFKKRKMKGQLKQKRTLTDLETSGNEPTEIDGDGSDATRCARSHT